jgi:hypothetical protein
MTRLSDTDAERLYGNRFLTEAAPSTAFPESGMSPVDAMRLVGEDLAMEGDCTTLDKKGGTHAPEREQIKEGTGYLTPA